MKIALLLTDFLAAMVSFTQRITQAEPAHLISDQPMSFYELTVPGLEGGEIRMADYKGKYVLCVNVASKCGYTPQYADLQELAVKYADKLVVIGFPCNQFLGQEPGDAGEIAQFCERNFGVTFPISAKINVKGKDQHPVYQWLTRKALNGVADDEVQWNFHKYLVSPEGKWLAAFPSKVEPLSDEILKAIGEK